MRQVRKVREGKEERRMCSSRAEKLSVIVGGEKQYSPSSALPEDNSSPCSCTIPSKD